MKHKIKTPIAVSLVAALLLQISACGTILYPERKGQTDGRLDPSIVILDAVGLLFFLVPGVIAFAVDFSNGTIYLPKGSAAASSEDLNVVSIEGDITPEKIERAILDHTGETVELDSSHVVANEPTARLTIPGNGVRFL